MRFLLATAALVSVAASAKAGGAEEFFMGRPPSVGMVQGGAFGAGGFDYLGEMQRGPSVASQPRRSAHRVARVVRVHRDDRPSVVAQPYVRP